MANSTESGFCPAGESITVQRKRAQSVRPHNHETLQPLHGKEGTSDDEDTEEADENKDVVPEEQWQQISHKVDSSIALQLYSLLVL